MLKIIKTAALSALIGFGALAATPASAQSGGIYLGFGSGNSGPSMGFHFGERGRYDYRERGRNRPGHYRNGNCSTHEAVRKASRMGLRHARVVRANHRTVRVQGRTHGYRFANVTFANARGCPVVR